MDQIVIRGARQHNLKNVDCDLPRNQLVVITGPSGSGKSSLAFDTLYAEGQRRYVESLSVYARQFLNQLPKPDVDSIEGLSPAIAIEQSSLGKNPRSTVGTVTEIADYLRLLFARVGVAHCPRSGRVLQAYSVQEIVDSVLARATGGRVVVKGPVVRREVSDLRDALARLRGQGFVRVEIDGHARDLGEEISLPVASHDLDVIVDRIAVRADARGRLSDSIELALRLGNGTVLLDFADGTPAVAMSDRLVSWEYGLTLPRLEPRLFSFNSPVGACPKCGGLGVSRRVDPERVVNDGSKSLREGALAALGRRGSPALKANLEQLSHSVGVDLDAPWSALPQKHTQQILNGTTAKSKGRAFEGVLPQLERLLAEGNPEGDAQDSLDGALDASLAEAFLSLDVCPDCKGARLRPEALGVTVLDKNIAELSGLELSELLEFMKRLAKDQTLGPQNTQIAAPLVRAMSERLGFLQQVGLGTITLDRSAASLSGGEGQRIRLATQIGAALVGVLYVLDEPSVGLHPRDNEQLLAALRKLVAKGNSVVVVEHDKDAILAADLVIDMGPGAGVLGGRIVASGTPAEIALSPNSVTGPYLREGSGVKRGPRRRGNGKHIEIRQAGAHNLKAVDVSIPLGMLTAVTGVSGSGKSSLVMDTLVDLARAELYGARSNKPTASLTGLEHIDKLICIDQSPIGRTPKSSPATYTGLLALLRELYATLPEARARGYKPGRFSFNVKGGRCEKCQGDGVLRVEMHFLPDLYVECDSCGGERYNRETLELKYKGHSIADVLASTVDAASELFSALPKIAQRLEGLRNAGLGYITLGQSATTLSGGEAQRLKLARELWRRGTGSTLYVLDEPTTGLHFTDIEVLLHSLTELAGAGNSVVVIEHNMDLVASADWVIDLGPQGGRNGGQVLAVGTPEAVANNPASVTGPYLRRALLNDG
jgi:excinuclease ABC subunit A